jgi:hypothetical protein
MIAWAVTDLPEPDSPRIARVSPVEVEAHAVDRLGDAVAGAELDVQVADVEQGGGGAAQASSRCHWCHRVIVVPSSAQLRVEGVADDLAEG